MTQPPASTPRPRAPAEAPSIGRCDWDIRADRVTSDTGFAALYGVAPELARDGAPIADFFGGIHPDDLPRVREAIDHSIASGAPFEAEYRLSDPEGRSRGAAARGRVARDAAGAAVHFPGVSFDIDQRKRAELR